MTSVKRTFTIPEDISIQLDKEIPNKERSKFIASSIRESLRLRKKNELLDFLSNTPRKSNPNNIQSEEVLREIRLDRANEIVNNS